MGRYSRVEIGGALERATVERGLELVELEGGGAAEAGQGGLGFFQLW